MRFNSVLNTTVSMLKTYTDTSPVDINLLDYLTDRSQKNKVFRIRAIGDKTIRDASKSTLPAVMISGRFKARGEQGLIVHSGLISFDIDHVEEMEAVRKNIIESPYVAYLSLSVSGRGLFGIVPISNKGKHKEHFAALRIYFDSLGIPPIDPAPSNVASLRGCSWDENAYFRHDALTFNYLFEEPVKPKKVYEPASNTIAGNNPFDDFNSYGSIEGLLESNGWTYQHTKGTRKRYSRPGKNTGISADYCMKRKILYLFSNNPATGLETPGRGYNNVQVFCQLVCGNDWKVCAEKLKALGYGTGQTQAFTQANPATSLQPNLNY